jgi:hypothetical protein
MLNRRHNAAGICLGVQNPAAAFQGISQWLFTHDVQAGFYRRHYIISMGFIRGTNCDNVNTGSPELFKAIRDKERWINGLCPADTVWFRVTNSNDFAPQRLEMPVLGHTSAAEAYNPDL